MAIRVCLFDIDGTLLSSGGAGKAAMETALASAFGVKDVLGGVPFSGRTDRAIAQDLFRAHGVEETPANWRRFLTSYLDHLPRCLSGSQGRVLPGIAELLEHLRAAGTVAVGLLTGNVRDGARLKLGHYNLYHHFAFGGFGDHHFDRCDVAREALGVLREHVPAPVELDDIWVIGDTPLDIQCARAIGVRVAAVATGSHTVDELAAEGPDCLLADLAEPQGLFDRWG